jgi:hypothetical protein
VHAVTISVQLLDVNNRRTMEAEIAKRAVDFIKRNASGDKSFFTYVSFSLMHMPTLPNPDFPTWQPFQPEAIGAVVEVTKRLKPCVSPRR